MTIKIVERVVVEMPERTLTCCELMRYARVKYAVGEHSLGKKTEAYQAEEKPDYKNEIWHVALFHHLFFNKDNNLCKKRQLFSYKEKFPLKCVLFTRFFVF